MTKLNADLRAFSDETLENELRERKRRRALLENERRARANRAEMFLSVANTTVHRPGTMLDRLIKEILPPHSCGYSKDQAITFTRSSATSCPRCAWEMALFDGVWPQNLTLEVFVKELPSIEEVAE